MHKAFERPFNPCKPGTVRLGAARSALHDRKDQVLRIALWITLSLALLGFSFLLDAPVEKLFLLSSSSPARYFAVCASKAGEGWVIAVFGASLALLLFLRRRFEASRMVFLAATTGLLTGAAATIIRSLVGRTRPSAHELQGFYGVWHDSHWLIGQYDFGAFPSGHVATVIGLAAAACLIDRRFGALASLYAVLVAWSRIALGCHHFSDTIAAGILGVYGAHLVFERLGSFIQSLWLKLQQAWLARKEPLA